MSEERPLKFHLDGYVLCRGGAAYARTFEFWQRRKSRGEHVEMRETLVRSTRTGRLLRVERPNRRPAVSANQKPYE